MFENDVKAEGTKLPALYKCFLPSFENDVKAEGTKLYRQRTKSQLWFENDVKAEGTKPDFFNTVSAIGLRMM